MSVEKNQEIEKFEDLSKRDTKAEDPTKYPFLKEEEIINVHQDNEESFEKNLD